MTAALLAIDPGNVESGWALLEAGTYLPVGFGKCPNDELLGNLDDLFNEYGSLNTSAVIEQIGHYGTGMSAGASVFDTCRWIGRFEQRLADRFGVEPLLVKRATVKAHICGSAKAGDGNVAQALADRFALGVGNRGKGTKADPGWFYGFARDAWQAYALGVYALDQQRVLG